MDEPWEYRVRDGSTYIRISARAKMLNDKDGKPFVIVIRYNNYSISDEVDATTGLHTEPALDREIMEFLEESGQGGTTEDRTGSVQPYQCYVRCCFFG